MADVTVPQLIEGMCEYFKPDAAQGVNAIVQYHLTGNEGGDWVITLKDGQCTVNTGTTTNPTMTLNADAQDYKDIITGKTNAMTAFMQGKVKLSGDLGLAMKLTSLFKM